MLVSRHLMDVSFNVEYEAKARLFNLRCGACKEVGGTKGKGKLAFTEVFQGCFSWFQSKVTTDGDDPEVRHEPQSDVPPAIREARKSCGLESVKIDRRSICIEDRRYIDRVTFS